jgi:predicted nicotinamide N-methyase
VSRIPQSHPASDRTTFIRAETKLLPVPLCPEIRLHLAEESIPLWRKTEEELAEAGLPPPFWAFAWAGGQALARYVLDHPDIVRGRTVLDIASGSGLVAIAAMKSGAASALAADIDPFALAAIAVNAATDDVAIATTGDDLIGADVEADIVLAGDIAYERDLAERLFAWLDLLQRGGTTVLIGDPGRSYLPVDRLEAVARYEVPVTRELEDAEIKRSTVWRLR